MMNWLKKYAWAITNNVIILVDVYQNTSWYVCHVQHIGAIYLGCGKHVTPQWFHHLLHKTLDDVDVYIDSIKTGEIIPAEGSVAGGLLADIWLIEGKNDVGMILGKRTPLEDIV